MTKGKIVVAMSGGVDSSVAAALLKEEGYEVEGIFMKNWSPETIQSLSDCPWEQDQKDAIAVCEHLGIPFRSINFEKEYKQLVVDYFLSEYQAGRTPNPDVMCNKEIKFKVFMEEALNTGAEYMATGHYVMKDKDGKLLRGVDINKDQSYFLWTLNKEQIDKTIFPAGGLTKPEVRKLAEKFQLPTATKKDSQGICFIGHLDLKRFLQEQLTSQDGDTYIVPPYIEGVTKEIRLSQAEKVGLHGGSIYYTIGEKAGAILDNKLYSKIRNTQEVPHTYVLTKDFEKNVIYITDQHDDPDLYTYEVTVEGWYCTGSDKGPEQLSGLKDLTCQIRYRQKERIEVESVEVEGDRLTIRTRQPLFAVASGQSLVLYQDEWLVGGGIIS